MGRKLDRSQFPANHGPNDFKCFGPPATKDGEFHGTKICDMGCFAQEEVDSNKYYHGAIVQSMKDNSWYVYFEYGRVGAKSPQFQFVQCNGEADADREYCSQLESKNIKRGRWETHAVLGKRLIPKVSSKGKPEDLYIVRPQATRSTGLPDAKTITSNEGLDESRLQKNGKKNGSAKKVDLNIDKPTIALMRDLGAATVKYTKASMADAALPTQVAINQGRAICQEALKCVLRVGHDIGAQINDKELKQLTRDMYGLVPKKKALGAAPETWILSQDNISEWQQDLDAFESALYVVDLGDMEVSDPFGGMKIKMEWVSPQSDLGRFLYDWWPGATRNVHGYLQGRMKIRNLWSLERHGDKEKLRKAQERIVADNMAIGERPLFQPKQRPDIARDELKVYVRSGTHMLFHGSRSVNISGILREGLRIPRQLVGVVITGAMFGSNANYFADDWKKSAGYTSIQGSYWSRGGGAVAGRGAFMFVCDVALGNPFIAPGPRGYTGPPGGYHSVFGKANVSGVANNEFMTYSPDQNSLKYLAEFDI
jgi:hypothetical protein